MLFNLKIINIFKYITAVIIVIAIYKVSYKTQPISFIAHTANVLGIFNDPFEFAGDYGNNVNSIREKVFDLLMPKEDKNYGPTLSEVISDKLPHSLKSLSISQKYSTDLEQITKFIKKYANQKIFYFINSCPENLLKLDILLKDDSVRGGKDFDLPIIGSTKKLTGKNSIELKSNLMSSLFNEKNINLIKSEEELSEHNLQATIDKLNNSYLATALNDQNAINSDLYVFCTPFGQIFFYWLYQALNLHLVSENHLIHQVNHVKEIFKRTLGDPEKRAIWFRDNINSADSKVVFVQEGDTFIPKLLTKDNLFLSADKQNFKNGTLVFLRSDYWEPNYDVIPIEDYENCTKGCLNAVLATQKHTKQKFFLVSGHGHSTISEDGRRQIETAVNKLSELSKSLNCEIIFLMGIDANTKSNNDIKKLKKFLNKFGLIATTVKPTTVKQRMLTVQHIKAGKLVADQEDYLIVKKNQSAITNQTIGFLKNPNFSNPLPNLQNQSDHYPVGATITSVIK